jgi:hypothetical protein
MTTSYDLSRMFNPTIKEEFLETYDNPGTQTTIAYLFYKAKETEEMKYRDLYDFTIDDIEELLYDLKPLTNTVSASYGRILSSYISWAISPKNLIKSNINPLTSKPTDWYAKFVDKSKKLYFSEEEIDQMTDELPNAQDQVIVQLLFEGVFGYKLSELSNLHYYDINWNTNEIELKDERKEEKRTIKVSDKCIRLIKSAYQELTYSSFGGKKDRELTLMESDYILKNIASGRTKNKHGVDNHTIYRKLTSISEYFNYPYLTAKSIFRSGMIKMAKDLFIEEGKLETEQLYKIAERFGYNKVWFNGEQTDYYNISPFRDFINRENILQMYNIDIEKSE